MGLHGKTLHVRLGIELDAKFSALHAEYGALPAGLLGKMIVASVLERPLEEQIQIFSQEYNCIVLLKGEKDVVCSPVECVEIQGGNAGMTKGGTGDVLAGLCSALFCKNEAFLAAASGSYINKKAGESLFKRVGTYFNASDLCDEIPRVMKELLL